MMVRKVVLTLMAITLLLATTACAATSYSKGAMRSATSLEAKTGGSNQVMDGGSNQDMMAEKGGIAVQGVEPTAISVDQINRKVIFNASFEVQTKEYDKTIEALNAQVEKTKSYIQHSNSYGDKEQGNAGASFVVRVPSELYEEFKLSVQTLGNIISSSEGGEDVTGDYFDRDARLGILTAQEKRVIELLDKADQIEDILKIEAELTRIRAEIEQLTTVLKRYDDLISYSTVTVSIYQTSDYVNKDDGFFARIINTIKNSLQSGLSMLQTIAYAIVWILPYAIILAIIALIVKAVLKKKNVKLFRKSAKIKEPEQDEVKLS